MNRRAFLSGLGGLTAVATVGCLADGSVPDSDPNDGNRSDRTTAADGTDGSTETDGPDGSTGTATDGSPAGTDPTPGTPPHDAPFPPKRDDVDRVVWYREVSDPDGSLSLAHSASSVDLPGDVSFTLSNDTGATFMTNFYNWALYRWADGWRRVAPTMVNDPLMELPPGESHTWTVAVRNDDLAAPTFRTSGTDELDVGALGGGRYAFAAQGWWTDQDATPTHEHKTVAAARVRLVGDRLELVPSRAVTGSRREGDTVVVSADNPRGEGTPATYVLTRDDDAANSRELVTEQVYRAWPLRDALAHAGDATEVRVETTTSITPLFGVHEDEGPAVTYDGRTYRIATEGRAD